ncbi:uncharacterized protein LOC144152900 isoform X2 [Haemaphysalis longicornis]
MRPCSLHLSEKQLHFSVQFADVAERKRSPLEVTMEVSVDGLTLSLISISIFFVLTLCLLSCCYCEARDLKDQHKGGAEVAMYAPALYMNLTAGDDCALDGGGGYGGGDGGAFACDGYAGDGGACGGD